jgi:hypothetical protein
MNHSSACLVLLLLLRVLMAVVVGCRCLVVTTSQLPLPPPPSRSSAQAFAGRLELQNLRRLPKELLVVAAEVTVGGGLLVDGPLELEVPDDATRPEVEVLLEDLDELLLSLALGSAVGLDQVAQGRKASHSVLSKPENTTCEPPC